jgi:hypothetical protein
MPKFALVLLLSAGCCSADVLGVLNASNILDWNLTVTDPNYSPTTFDILGPLSGANSQVGLVGSDLSATSSNLTFNFSGSDNGYLLFQFTPLFNGTRFWCSAASPFPNGCSNDPSVGESLSTFGNTEDSPVLSGSVVIASGGHDVGSDTIYNVDQSWSVGNDTFSVVGTIETGAVPEPSMLWVLALGMAAMGFWKLRAPRSS